jgi:mitogen-activated protein kinase kinase
MKLSDMGGGAPAPGMRRAGAPKLSDMGGDAGNKSDQQQENGTAHRSKMDDFKKYIDTEKGWITFDGAATITRTGVNFANGQTFSISLDEVEVLDELGKGNYGTVYKVKHSKPRQPRFGQGLSKARTMPLPSSKSDPSPLRGENGSDAGGDAKEDGTTGVTMAMKEIRLELDDAKFTTILKELVILHECVSPYIIDFYGAFFQEGAVYMCIEFMDGGSIDKIYSGGIPENILRKITYSAVMGLKSLKDDHNIIHRDVKPTNILANTRGQVKICDFGVSGNLVASIAKTNIGCQSYMAPERISGGSMAPTGNADGTYSVQSDIWSLGLTIIECAVGHYPYPPEVSHTIFSQLNAIVEGEPPGLPETGYSDVAKDFVRGCLNKVPKLRPTYAMLLNHAWLKPLTKPQTITEEAEEGEEAEQVAEAVGKLDLNSGTHDQEVAEWVKSVLQRKKEDKEGHDSSRPALHAAPLDSVSPLASPLAGV